MDLTSAHVVNKKVCIVTTTPLIIHFFLKSHITGLATFAEVILALNACNDSYTPDLDLPARIEPIAIKRQISPFADVMTLMQLLTLFSREKPELVLAVSPKGGLLGMLAARLAGVKQRVFIFQGEVWASKTGIMRWILKFADKVCASCSTNILAVSLSERLFLEQEMVVAPGRIQVLGSGSICGVDVYRYKPNCESRRIVRSELEIPTDAVVALFVGRLTEDKGVLVLAEAFRSLALSKPNTHLLIVGPDEQDMEPKIREILGSTIGNCHILGFTSYADRYMAAADFICLPSYREAFGMVIVEAAGVGVPAIGSRIPGIIDSIKEGKTGLLFEPGNVDELRNAMIRLIEDPSLRQQLGLAARNHVLENLSSSVIVEEYINFYKSLLYSKQFKKVE